MGSTSARTESIVESPHGIRVVVFGGTGTVGHAVVRECLRDPGVSEVLVVGRTSCGLRHPKLREILRQDVSDLAGLSQQLGGFDACMFCLGISAAGVTEEAYRRVTYDLTLSVAQWLEPRNPNLTFIYVSGSGTDSTERGLSMWARVKGATENALLSMPFRRAYMFRPGVVQPLQGSVAKTKLYRVLYRVLRPVFPLLKRAFPSFVTTSEELARAMLRVAKHGASAPVIENRAIRALGAPEPTSQTFEPQPLRLAD